MNPLPTHTLIIAQTAADRNQQRSKRRGGVKHPFPERLFDLLEEVDARKPEYSSIISWHPNGTSTS